MTSNALKYFIAALLIVGLSASVILGLILPFAVPPVKMPDGLKVFLGLSCREWLGIHIVLFIILLRPYCLARLAK